MINRDGHHNCLRQKITINHDLFLVNQNKNNKKKTDSTGLLSDLDQLTPSAYIIPNFVKTRFVPVRCYGITKL